MIRGNEAEIRALNQELRGHETGNTGGVDSETFGTIESRMETACSLRDLTGAVVVMTGVEDVVAGKEKKFIVRNGHPWMARITERNPVSKQQQQKRNVIFIKKTAEESGK